MGFKEYIKELSIVILGIIIAFWINNMGIRYNSYRQQKLVLHTILNEQIDNMLEIESIMSNLDTIYQNLNEIKDADKGSISFIYNGISQNNIGYETAKHTGLLNGLDYNLLSKIVISYELQRSLLVEEKTLLDEFHNLFKKKGKYDYDFDFLILLISNYQSNVKDYYNHQTILIQSLKTELKLEE